MEELATYKLKSHDGQQQLYHTYGELTAYSLHNAIPFMRGV